MGIDEVSFLKEKITELEEAIQERDRQLNQYEDDIEELNQYVKSLISQIQVEIQLAHKIQKALVPTEIPSIPGLEFSSKYLASMIKGGDYFDIFELQNKFHFGVLVASSTGHAMSALFLSILLKITARVEAKKGMAPGEVLNLVSKEIAQEITDESEASLFYCNFDRKSLSFTYSGAGLVGSYLISNNKANELTLKGPALCKTRCKDYKTQKISLNPKDRIVLVSEGVLRAATEEGDEFGSDRLLELLQKNVELGVHELRNEILFEVQKFSKQKELQRDLTVLVVDVKEKVLKLAK
jgi:sigma-B regulation protein RsbU (phosphoserine phosphatase)